MSAAHDAHTPAPVDQSRLTPEQGKRLVTIGGALAAIGLLASLGAVLSDSTRFAYAWLTGFEYVLTIGLGALCFIIIQHLGKAGWSVAARRQMEWIAGVLPACALLYIPVAIFAPRLYQGWWQGAGSDENLREKLPYLNPTFFYVRAALYFVAWIGVSRYYRMRSLEQDASGDPGLTKRMEKWAPPFILITGYTLTFGSAFDWIMSMTPHWYSTIFGIYVFAGGFVSSIALLALMTVQLQDRGLFRRVSTVEHRHDIGKYLLSFTIFFAYIGFSQFMLIWYANIPEETIFFDRRWHGTWGYVTASILFGMFVVPFCVLLSRTAKRNSILISLGAVILLVFHYVDMYWLVMPNYAAPGLAPTEVPFGWIEVAGLLGPVGVLALVLAVRASKDPLYPLKDPRLAETYKIDNP